MPPPFLLHGAAKDERVGPTRVVFCEAAVKPKMPSFLAETSAKTSQPARKKQRLERNLHSLDMLG